MGIIKKIIHKIKTDLYPITWISANDKGPQGRVWFWQFWVSPLKENRKQIITIIITAIITVFLCYGFYLNYLKISYCKYCGKEIKGNVPYCSKKCYEKAEGH